jgi:hypothetical protein
LARALEEIENRVRRVVGELEDFRELHSYRAWRILALASAIACN